MDDDLARPTVKEAPPSYDMALEGNILTEKPTVKGLDKISIPNTARLGTGVMHDGADSYTMNR